MGSDRNLDSAGPILAACKFAYSWDGPATVISRNEMPSRANLCLRSRGVTDKSRVDAGRPPEMHFSSPLVLFPLVCLERETVLSVDGINNIIQDIIIA